ncbi:AI-2E family transporter [Candidatus Rhodobacter oscarellae]|nr:AI-2E family transporter [Candidatus Rhodobacter lobularis]
MALTVQQQFRIWGIAAAVFLVVLWYLGNTILPFVLGGAIAYCLDPIADRLENWGLSRAMATTVIMLGAVLVFVILALAVIPALAQQGSALVSAAPQYMRDLQAFLTERFPALADESSVVRQSLERFGAMIQEKGGALINSVLSSAAGLLNIVVLLVIVPVVAFYLLLDWDHMVARVDEMLPRDHLDTIRLLAREIDNTLAAFIRGQGTVMLIQGTFYAVALALVGLNFGLVVGAIAGILSFIPYVGAIVGGGLAIGLALFQFWGEWFWLIAVVVIFFFGQFVEGNILTPKLVGSSVGLHPVWLLFALSVFGALFGFVGLLLAVPITAALGVVARFGLGQYMQGPLYQGERGADDPGDAHDPEEP